MLNSLYSRLSLSLFIIFIFVAAMLLWLFEYSSKAIQNETTQKLHLDLAAHIVDDLVMLEDGEFDTASIKSAFHMMMLLGPSIELYIVDVDGSILTYDAPEEKIKLDKISLKPVEIFLNKTKELPILGDDPRSEYRQKIFSVAPIHYQDQLKGYLYIIIGGELHDSIATALQISHVWQVSAIGMIAALAFMLVILLMLFYAFTRPLRALTIQMDFFAKNGFKQLPEKLQGKKADLSKKHHEIAQLESTFYTMGELILDQLNKLEKHDELRREFLSHISHDLRTPLAATQANLESLLLTNANENCDEQQKAVLEKSLYNCQRQGKLIQELFDLARLEDHQVDVSFEQFPLMDLISDLLQGFSAALDAKQITLKVHTSCTDAQVTADVAKVERVLQNLLENAIRYTPNGSEIGVQVEQDSATGRYKIAVLDNGPGIAKDDVPYLFEPYFTSRKQGGAYKQGTGLGLAISKKLVQLHGSELEIETGEGEGCCFSFQLAQADMSYS